MRAALALIALALTACAAPSAGTRLTPGDSATELITGGPLTMTIVTQGSQEGEDPLVTLTLTRADGRSMRFVQSNHAQTDLVAQKPGGALASAMGFFADEAPQLYQTTEGGSGAPFVCGPDGPQSLGFYQAAPGSDVTIIGMKSPFEFEQRDDGSFEALPYSPDHVCARLKFRAG